MAPADCNCVDYYIMQTGADSSSEHPVGFDENQILAEDSEESR